MPVFVTGKVKHVNGRDAVIDAQDVSMQTGLRLDAAVQSSFDGLAQLDKDLARMEKEVDLMRECPPAFAVLPGVGALEPEKFYDFGAVAELVVTLSEKNDGKAHEYWLRFEPQEGFLGLTISPEVKWVAEPQYPAGKTCTVGICMGMAVMAVV